MPKVYSVDIDETVEISGGPITLKSLMDLRVEGHIVGICGNLNRFMTVPGWWHLSSFTLNWDTGPYYGGLIPKEVWLRMFKEACPNMEDYVMVGNILGVSGASDDKGAADRSGWRFISEKDFARGIR